MTIDAHDFTPPERSSPAGLMLARSTALLLQPVQAQLATWQASIVRLVSAAERLRAAGRTDPRLADEARALKATINEQARRFEDLIGLQHPDIANHPWVETTRQSLKTAVLRIDAVLDLLGDSDRAPHNEL